MQTILSNSTKEDVMTQKTDGITENSNTHSFNFFKSIEYLYLITLFLLPVFFLPFTSNYFNLNKNYLIIFVAAISLILFFAGSIKRNQLMVRDFKAYTVLFIVLISAVLSTIFSVDRYLSLFGAFGNYGASLMIIVSLVIISFVSTNVRLNLSKLIMGFYFGVTLASLVSLVSIYFRWLPLLGQVPGSFNTAEGTNLLMGLQIVSIAGAFYQYLKSNSKLITKILAGIVIVLNFIYITATFYAPAIILIVIVLAVIFYFEFDSIIKQKGKIVVVASFMVLFAVVNMLPATRTLIGLNNFVSSPRLGVIESWLVSSSTLRLNPLFGRGLGTFQYEFSRYRPQSLNSDEQWLYRFQSPYNDVFMWLGSAGLVGIISYLLFVYYLGKTSYLLQSKTTGGKEVFVITITGLSVLLLLGSSNIIYLLLFIIFGVLLQSKVTVVHTVKSKGVSVLLLAMSLGLLGLVGVKGFGVYAAQYNYLMSLQSGKTPSEVISARQSAVNFDKRDDFYRREWVLLNLRISSAISRQEKPGESEIQIARAGISEAIRQSQILTSKSPYNVANWQLQGTVYSSILNIAAEGQQRQQVLSQALRAYATALSLEPTNPRLNLDVGGIYFRAKDYRSAINQYALAVESKPNYANARYNLAVALKEFGAYEQAVQQLEAVLRIVPEDNSNYGKVKEELDSYKKLRDEQIAKHQDQKVQQLPEVSQDLEKNNGLTEDLKNAGVNEDLDVKPAEELEISVPLDQDETKKPEEILPAADGSEVDLDQGQREAPIANPAQ